MSFLRRAWYCFGWSHEVSRRPLSRTLLGTPIVTFRKEDGAVVALGDTCPHRFAPLHLGKLRGDAIECPYHGLQFSESGACIFNPHNGPIPPRAKVRSFPVVERHQVLWIWMGEPTLADPTQIPDCSHNDDPAFKTFFGYVHVGGHYELVNDNLLDLTHVRFLHPAFQAPNSGVFDYDLRQEQRTVTSIYNIRDTEKSSMLEIMWPEGPERVDIFSVMRWVAPSNLVQKNCNTGVGRSENEGIVSFASHIITPETETSSHYFLSYSRNWRREDAAFEAALRAGIERAIRDDDAAMIQEVQRRMGPTGDLMSLRPVVLSTDSAAIRARRILARLIKEEAGSKGEANGADPATAPARVSESLEYVGI